MGNTVTYTKLQVQWLKHHYILWQREYSWSAGEFAKRVKQPPVALAEVLGIPVEDFVPLPEVAAPDSITLPPPVFGAPALELPEPGSETVIVGPGQEWLPAQKAPPPPSPAAPREPYYRGARAWVMLKPGHHVIDGADVDVHPPADNPIATLVAYEVAPHVPHIVDGRNAVVQTTSMFNIHP